MGPNRWRRIPCRPQRHCHDRCPPLGPAASAGRPGRPDPTGIPSRHPIGRRVPVASACHPGLPDPTGIPRRHPIGRRVPTASACHPGLPDPRDTRQRRLVPHRVRAASDRLRDTVRQTGKPLPPVRSAARLATPAPESNPGKEPPNQSSKSYACLCCSRVFKFTLPADHSARLT